MRSVILICVMLLFEAIGLFSDKAPFNNGKADDTVSIFLGILLAIYLAMDVYELFFKEEK